MSTLEIFERHFSPFDILFRNQFKSDSTFQPVGNFKQPHPLNIFYDDAGLNFEVACTGLTKKDIVLDIEGDTLKISYNKTEEETFHDGMIHNGLSKKSFDLRYKIAPKFDLTQIDAALTNGLLEIFIPLAEEAKPKSIKIK
jgi:HSP20 family molecular chaperone IbpA